MRENRYLPLAAASLMFLLGSEIGLPAPSQAAPKLKPGNLKVTVLLEGEKDFESGSLYIHDRSQPLEKGKSTLLVEGLTPRNYAVTAEAVVSQGWLKSKMRYVGVQEAAVLTGRTEEVTVTLRPVENMNEFCLACHPEPDQPTPPGMIRRDLHVSGKVLEKKYRDRVEVYNDQVAAKEKKGLPHNQPIVLEEREVVEKGRKTKKMFYTCESCHTLHWKSAPRSYTVAPYKESNDLCNGCHP